MTRLLSALTTIAVMLLGWAATASAQLDPLLFLKATRPRVLVALDLSSRMQRDAAGRYYDPVVFQRTGAPFETALGINDQVVDGEYRRRYVQLTWSDPAGPVRAVSRSIEIVGDREPVFAQFDASTRLGRARTAVRHVVEANAASVRFGLLPMRQAGPRIDRSAWSLIGSLSPDQGNPTDGEATGQWRAGIPIVDGPGTAAAAGPPLVPADGPNPNADVLRLIDRRPGSAGGLLPAGYDTPDAIDAPLGSLLDDLRAEAARLIAADAACCNTVAILIVSGGDPSLQERELGDRAATFLAVGGRRVPVYVIALAPEPTAAAQLALVASRSGGRYFEIPGAAIEAVPASEVVPELAAALNLAVQHAFVTFANLNAPPSPSQPTGPPSFFPTASPVVGTVNLTNASDAGGARLPDTLVVGPRGEPLPQLSNVMFTTGFELPGFLGRLSAFRVYRPVPDAGRVTGYRFSADGTRLWTASTPAADQRNLFTVLPGVGLVPFRAGSAALLAPFLGVRDPAALIAAVRSMPLGPIVSSTPALLEPPPAQAIDADYLSFAADHANRRSLVFVGADDGMMHAFDARTGMEAWAVVPFNLLPKLRLLPEGLPLDAFPHLVDGSPRLADVKVLGSWRTFLVFGEGPGGTFYQAFDVTLDGIGGSLPPDADNTTGLLAWFADTRRIPFKWSYPRYDQFDPAIPPFGDLRASATDSEKTVGETWSTPAIGRAGGAAAAFVAVVGSGHLDRSRERQAQRGGKRAGTTLYMLDVASGGLLDSRDVGSDGVAEDQDSCTADSCARLKNALHADPLGLGPPGSAAVTRVYQGDLDGRLWRFDVAAGAGPPGFSGSPRLLLENGAEQPVFGSVAVLAGSFGQAYLFLGTGSDLLPRVGVAAGYRLLGVAESASGIVGQFDRLLRTAAIDGVDERPASMPSVGGSVVFFATTSVRPGSSCDAAEATLYALTADGGVAYDANGDRRRDARDAAAVSHLTLGRATGPVVADRHVFMTAGDRLQVYGDPEGFDAGPGFLGIRIVSWREVR